MLEVNLFNILGIAVLGNMLSHWYEPIQAPKGWIIRSLTHLLPTFLGQAIERVLNCSKCSSFILGLTLFWELPTAALCAFLGLAINWSIDLINDWYE